MRLSLRHKAVLIIIAIALVLSAISIVVGVRFVSNIVRDNYETEATNLSRTVASVVDAGAVERLRNAAEAVYDSIDPDQRVPSDDWGSDAFYEYLSNFEALSETEDFTTIFTQIRGIQDVNDVKCIYVAFVEHESAKFVYLVDAAKEDPCPIGCFDPLYEENRRLLDDPTVGFPTYTTNTEEYGYLATSGTAIYNDAGDVVGYAMVDVSMEDIASLRNSMLSFLLGLQALVIVLVTAISIAMVNRAVVRPVKLLSQAARDYRSGDELTDHSHFKALNIHTHDEIEDLSESMKKMEQDLNDKIANLLQTTNELTASRMEASILSEIAMKDALTGVRNKRAYDRNIQLLEQSLDDASDGSAAAFGMAVIDLDDLKKINDTYGHEKGDIAIKKLCDIVCSVFANSAVYRIGGDEFTVVLKGPDLSGIDDLIERFNSTLLRLGEDEDLAPWEKVTASIGYAIFNADRDGSPYETFRRADSEMYLHKQERKARK